MAIKSRYTNPLHDDPCRFIGKLLVLPSRYEDKPVLFVRAYWDDDGGGFDAFFLHGEKIVQHYFSRATFFSYACIAQEYFG